MNMKRTFLIGLLVLSAAFGAGLWVGFHMDRGDVDPQDYIETVFTPYEDGLDHYLAFLDKAQKSVQIAAYSYTDPRVTDKLIELKTRRKVTVQVLLDLSQTRGWSGPSILAQAERLRAAGIEVVFGTSEKSKEIMHHKYTVIDGVWVEDGSWNYTKAADDQANAQNFMRSPKRAKLFLANWERMYRFMKAQEAQRALEPKSAPADSDDGSAPKHKTPSRKKTK